MSSAPVSHEHLHIYERSLSNKEIFRCLDPDCTHYQKREFLNGKRAKCFKCHEPFILTWNQLKNKHPVCLSCSKSKKAEEFRSVADQIANLFPVSAGAPAPKLEIVEVPEVKIPEEPKMEWK